jgi:nucleolar protein 53
MANSSRSMWKVMWKVCRTRISPTITFPLLRLVLMLPRIVAQRMRRAHKPLRSLAVLSERSAVPSLTSRVSSSSPASSSHKIKLSPHEKARLRRIARKTVIGSDGAGLGSADISVVAAASRVLRDAWGTPAAEAVEGPVGGFGEEAMRKIEPKAPITLQRQREIRRAQVEEGLVAEVPGAGTSYNPSQEAHEKLLEKAVEQELGKLAGEAREEMRAAILGEVVKARKNASAGEYAPGMTVGPGDVEEDQEEDDEEETEAEVKKTTKRKTQAQRNKAARKKELARLEKIAAREKKLHKSIGGVSGLKKLAEQRSKEAAEAERARRLAKREKERMGLEGGEKVGKHRVKKADVAVQLGEDLAESLRQVKVGCERESRSATT